MFHFIVLIAKIRIEKDKPAIKKINGRLYIPVILNFNPGIFHVSRPVNIINNKNRIAADMFYAFLKIL